jgi:hypothetical protein
MNELRRVRIKCQIDLIAHARELIDKIRDDEDRAIRGENQHGAGCQASSDFLSEASHRLMVVIDRLQKAKQ